MTDAELRDAAVLHLKKTRQGYLKSNGDPRPLVGAEWKKALDYLVQIGSVTPPSGLLPFSPPPLTNPTTIQVTNANKQLSLDPTKDYILKIVEKLTNFPGFWIQGGRNVHCIGGHVAMEVPGTSTGYWDHTAVKIRDIDIVGNPKPGHVFVEGLLVDGAHTSDGIVIAASLKTVTVQNTLVKVKPRPADEPGMHEDVLQIQGACGRLQIDKLTGYTPLQGLFLQSSAGLTVGPMDIRRVNTHGAFHAFFQDQDFIGPIALSEFWIGDSQRPFGLDVWPQSDGYGQGSSGRKAVLSMDGNSLTFAGPGTPTGRINKGNPPGGDFVPAGVAGLGYVSPGYA